jgi:hypothetical protein
VQAEFPLPSYGWDRRDRVADSGLEPGGLVRPFSGAGQTIECFPNGACEPKTLYFENKTGGDRTRVVVMPLNGSPLVFDAW